MGVFSTMIVTLATLAAQFTNSRDFSIVVVGTMSINLSDAKTLSLLRSTRNVVVLAV